MNHRNPLNALNTQKGQLNMQFNSFILPNPFFPARIKLCNEAPRLWWKRAFALLLLEVLQVCEVLIPADCFFVFFKTFQVYKVNPHSLDVNKISRSVTFLKFKPGHTCQQINSGGRVTQLHNITHTQKSISFVNLG